MLTVLTDYIVTARPLQVTIVLLFTAPDYHFAIIKHFSHCVYCEEKHDDTNIKNDKSKKNSQDNGQKERQKHKP